MKYIEFPALSRLAQSLNHEGPECSVHTRIEAYSCKNIKRDKKLFKSLETAYRDEVSHSPPGPSWLTLDHEAEMTPFGPIDKQSSRKTLYLLIGTLNVAFPDHDFSDVRPNHFNKEESGASVLNALSTTLIAPHRAGVNAPRTYSSYPPTSADLFPNSVPTSSSPQELLLHSPSAPPAIVSGTHPSIFRQIDEVIGLSDCEVFSYTPEIEADPHSNDFEDDDDDVASVGDEDLSGDDDALFEFDDYDIGEINGFQHRRYTPMPPPTPKAAVTSSIPSFMPTYPAIRLRRRGALLWSSHWFFLNRKLKRILFISIWARTRGVGRSWTDEESPYAFGSSLKGSVDEDLIPNSERFFGWEGGIGAGARALGLSAA